MLNVDAAVLELLKQKAWLLGPITVTPRLIQVMLSVPLFVPAMVLASSVTDLAPAASNCRVLNVAWPEASTG